MTRALAIAVVVLAALTACYGQSPTPSPATSTPTAEKVTNDQQATAISPAAPSSPEPDPDFWTQQELTGDWGGTRSRWKEKGIDLEFKLSNFFQGVASGGLREESEYNGKFEYTMKFDLGKVAGWKYWSSEIKAEVRWGGPVLGSVGSINPVNTAALTPGANGEVISVTGVNFTRIIPKDLKKGDLFVVSFGRFNLLDLIDEDFFGGAGTERFFNMAQIGPLTVLRQVPLVANGASFAYVKHGEPRFSIAVIDPNDHTLEPGLDDFMADGVTFYPTVYFPVKYFGKTAKHTFSVAVTTKEYTPFDAIRQVVIPGPPRNPVEPQRGSWSISYAFRQYFVERAPKDGWGFFSQVSFADRATSPITRFVNVGIGGNGLIESRRNDEFGVAYAYTDLSKVLKDNIDLLTIGNRGLRAEHQFEAFYNLHLTPWLRLTGDIQIIRPTRLSADTAVVPGGRLVMIF